MRGVCSIDGCGREARARGWCSRHWQRWRRHGDPRAGRWEVLRREADRPCAVEDCGRGYFANGFCAAHNAAFKRYGDPLATAPPRERKGQYETGDGYIALYRPDHPNARPSTGLVLEHVVVMSDHLGRPLRKGETVHHRNGIRTDNAIENLELWVSPQPAGQRVTDLVAFARQVLATYADEVDGGLVQ